MLFDDENDDLIDDDGGAQPSPAGEELLLPRNAIHSVGHAAIEKQLIDQFLSGKMPHAMIFSGPAGIGKSTMAFRLAKFLLSQKAPEDAGPSLFGDPEPPPAPSSLSVDPELQAARLVSSAGHPDLLTLARKTDEKTGAVKDSLDVEQVRGVGPFLHLTPFMGGWRIVIIDDADTMTRNSQNALLKALEEPPGNSLLILIAHRAGQLIPTIRSRSRVIDFSTLPQNEFDALLKKVVPHADNLQALYNISGGSIGVALRLAESGALKAFDQVTKLLAPWPDLSWTDIHLMGEVLNTKGQDDSLQGFQDVLSWTVETVTACKAKGLKLPVPLDSGPYPALMNDYPLERWAKICENLKDHFATVKYGNLDRRQAVFGAFSILKDAA